MDFVFELLGAVMDFKLLAYVFIGTFFGIVAGAIPGFTILMAVILVFPFTFSMSPLEGLSTMIGVYVGGGAGGQVSGILLGIPGTPSSICTVFDGYPLAQKGKAGLALGLGIFGSFFGGLIGVLSLVLLLKPAAEFGLKFGPWEMFSLVLFSLTLIASLGEKSFLKGLIGGAFGLILATIGIDDTGGTLRFTFGSPSLTTGITLLPTLVGLFAFPHLLKGVEQRRQLQHAGDQQSMLGNQNLNIPYREVFGCLKNTGAACCVPAPLAPLWAPARRRRHRGQLPELRSGQEGLKNAGTVRRRHSRRRHCLRSRQQRHGGRFHDSYPGARRARFRHRRRHDGRAHGALHSSGTRPLQE